jgi:hypothetical protein
MRLPHTCTIQSRTAGTADSYGESAYTWATSASSVACRFYYASRGEVSTRGEGGEGLADTLMLMLGSAVTIARDTYRITTTQSGYAGTYRIAAIRPRAGQTGALHHYEVELEAVA